MLKNTRMKSEEIIGIIDRIISCSCFTIHEEEISANTWCDQVNLYSSSFSTLLKCVHLFKEFPSKTLSRLIICIGGCLGNNTTTKKLCQYGDALYNLVDSILSALLNTFNVKSLCEFLSTPAKRKMQTVDVFLFDTFIEETARCISNCALNADTNTLNKCPLFRDAMLWVANLVNYPILSNSRQLIYLHPLALQILEDYRPQLKICGLKLLKHLSAEILTSCWRTTGRCEATLDVLMTQRSTYCQTNILLNKSFECIFRFLHLLEPSQKQTWNNRLMELLLSDLALESDLERRIILTKYVLIAVELLGPELMVHSRRLLKAAELNLLAPRAPFDRDDLRKREYKSFLGTLEVIKKYASIASKKMMPDLITLILPLLVAFIDLEWSRKSADVHDSDKLQISNYLSDIISILADFEHNESLVDVLKQCTNTVEYLKPILNNCRNLPIYFD